MLTANIPSCKLDTVWYNVSHVIRQLDMQYRLCGTPGGNAKKAEITTLTFHHLVGLLWLTC